MRIFSDLLLVLILKILTYDQELETKAGEDIMLGIVYPPDMMSYAGSLKSEFDALKEADVRVSGHPFDTALIPESELPSSNGWIAWLVLSSSHDRLLAVSSSARKFNALTMTTRAGLVDPFSLGLSLEGNKITIYRCDDCLKSENINLSAQFLKITKLKN